MTKEVTIRVDLNDDLADKFLKLKKKWGLKTYTETVRHLIQVFYEEMIEEKSNTPPSK